MAATLSWHECNKFVMLKRLILLLFYFFNGIKIKEMVGETQVEASIALYLQAVLPLF
jgi:hypothetical protein